MKQLLKTVGQAFGLDIKRRPDPQLPFVHELTCGGTAFRFWIANQHTKRWWGQPELPLNAELRSQKEMCTAGSVVLDVGAHHGLHSVLFALWAGPTGQVHAFEACAENALVLSANIGLNRLANCRGVYAAVGRSRGSVSLNGESVAAGSGRQVPLLALDDYCAEQGLERVDVLKIDVEGYEGEVLRGARRVLAGRPRIDLELHLDDLTKFGSSAGEVLGQIDLAAYRCSVMVRPDWETVRPFTDVAALPASGVANLFFWPLT